ncbi:single-stranded DNA-binding protein [Stenotrophomonas sp. ATCM1_4]|uniref:ERF family protein n=1 Tax=Stenotrophomonas sp. ATCM1_4 TaxID=2259330 RepID=UPI001048E95D|nr:ERF family protein [Stenotrophomonas sp. ATCM1_4]TDB26825.1 single-stranded DNA-binding protein [Stenotrophomonas sp. ATCM1_4]
MNAVVAIEPDNFPQPSNEGATILAVISRAAADPNCDIEKMERLLQMHERIQARQAAADFAADLAEMQDALPSIGERGNAAGRYTYALWEDINTAVKPILKRFGFALSFRTDFADGIAVTGVLSHKGGHREETTIKLPADPSGNKNAVQAVASSVSYGKRYAAGALLNLTSHGEDDDAFATAETEEKRAEREKAKRWVAVADGLKSHEVYKAKKAEVLADYGGNASDLPPSVRAAFNRAGTATKPRD